MADYETSKYSIPSTANAIIPGSAIQTDSIEAAEINANAVGSSELANNAVDTAAIIDANVTGAKIANSTISVDKLNASGAKNGDTYLAGDNSFKALSIPPSAVSSVRYKSLNQSVSKSGGNGSIPAQTWVYTASGNEVVICTFSYTGVSTGTGGNDTPGVSAYNLNSSTSGSIIGHNFSITGSRDIKTSGNVFIASLTSGQTATVTRTASATLVTQGQSATWTSNGVMIVEVATASTF